jgi:predicted Zn-dependent peptidase
MFQRTTIPDGPRVITARLPGARSVAASVYVLAGSRAETDGDAGAAHFMEHLTFRGTAGYPSSQAISEAVEGIGGVFNAATDRESTVYWAKVPGRETERAVDVLADLIVRPLLRDGDIAGERDIIVEEIRSYRDDPADLVGTLFDLAVFGETPLGREIAGDESSVRSLEAATLHDFWSRAYRPANCVVALAGDVDHDAVVGMVRGSFGTGNGVAPGYAPVPSLPSAERFRRMERDTSQAHVCVGVPALRRDHPESWALELMNTVLGEGMSSRLFLILREQLGLAYDVSSLLNAYRDCGIFGVCAGVDPEDLGPALDAVLVQLARLRDEAIRPHEMEKAKAFAGGRLELRLEETHHLAAWVGVQEALHDEVLDLDTALARLNAVTPDQIQDLAGRLLRDEQLALAVVAPPGAGPDLEQRLRFP